MLPKPERIPSIKKLCSIFLGSRLEALKAWSELRQTLILKSLSSDELKVIPQLIPRLAELDLTKPQLDPQLELIQQIFNSQKNTTQKIHQNFHPVLKSFPRNTPPPLLLKGAALWKLFPKYSLNRNMSDLDILIPLHLRETLVEHFQRQGWKLGYDYRYQKFNWNHAFSFGTPQGVTVDLHWYLFKEDMSPDTVNAFFQSGTTHSEQGVSYQLPSPEHLFYHLVIHGCRFNSGSGIQWVLDSLLILSKTQKFNWEKVTNLVQRAKLQKSFYLSMEILKQMEVTIPIDLVGCLSRHCPSEYELLQFKLSQIPPVDYSTLGVLPILKRYLDFYFLWHHRFRMQNKWLSPFDFIRYYASSPTNLGAFIKLIIFGIGWLRHRLKFKHSRPVAFNRSY